MTRMLGLPPPDAAGARCWASAGFTMLFADKADAASNVLLLSKQITPLQATAILRHAVSGFVLRQIVTHDVVLSI